MAAMLRRYFVAGLLVWIPLGITIWVLKLLVDMMDQSLLLLPENFRSDALFGFHVPGLVDDLDLRPRIADLDHQVADHLAIELDHEGLRQRLGVLEVRPVLVPRLRGAGEPSAHRLHAADVPRRLEVLQPRRSEAQPRRRHRPLHIVGQGDHGDNVPMSMFRFATSRDSWA